MSETKNLYEKVHNLETKVVLLEKSFVDLSGKFDVLSAKLDSVSANLDGLSGKLDTIIATQTKELESLALILSQVSEPVPGLAVGQKVVLEPES
jgi:hypothetical protein